MAARVVDEPSRLPLFGGLPLGLTGTALVASCDEWHQTFLPNRTGSPWDVLLDCCGALVMLLIVYIFLRYVPAQAAGSRELTGSA